jgi:hypothetical protein
MSTALPVAYVHSIRYFNKGIDARGPYYRVEYIINNYSDVDNFINALLGKTTVTGGTVITRTEPHQHPLSTNLWCQQAEFVEATGGPTPNVNGYPAYNGYAVIRAEYRAPSFDFVSNPANSFDPAAVTPVLWATQELDFGHETYTVNRGTYTYTAGPAGVVGTPSHVPVKITIPLTILSLTFEKTPLMAMTAVRALRYRVNNSAFLGAAAGLVLFEGGRTSRQFNADGTAAQKTQFVFKERDAAYPWNSLPNVIDFNWYPVSDGTRGMFPTDDLTPLLSF